MVTASPEQEQSPSSSQWWKPQASQRGPLPFQGRLLLPGPHACFRLHSVTLTLKVMKRSPANHTAEKQQERSLSTSQTREVLPQANTCTRLSWCFIPRGVSLSKIYRKPYFTPATIYTQQIICGAFSEHKRKERNKICSFKVLWKRNFSSMFLVILPMPQVTNLYLENSLLFVRLLILASVKSHFLNTPVYRWLPLTSRLF